MDIETLNLHIDNENEGFELGEAQNLEDIESNEIEEN